jgi:hypothetical protein
MKIYLPNYIELEPRGVAAFSLSELSSNADDH